MVSITRHHIIWKVGRDGLLRHFAKVLCRLKNGTVGSNPSPSVEMNTKKQKWLFVDDELSRYLVIKKNNPDVDITWVQTCDAAADCLENISFDIVFLDHDLGMVSVDPIEEQNFPRTNTDSRKSVITSIRPLVVWIVNNFEILPLLIGTRFISHTANPVGGQWTKDMLKSVGFDAEYTFAAWYSHRV